MMYEFNIVTKVLSLKLFFRLFRLLVLCFWLTQLSLALLNVIKKHEVFFVITAKYANTTTVR